MLIPLSSLLLRNKLNVKQAIDYIAQAWDDVSVTTIRNCWHATGILLGATELLNADDLADVFVVVDLMPEFKFESEIARDIEQYMQILDEPIATETILNDEEIIVMVQADMALEQDLDPGDTDEDEMPPPPLVSLQQACDALRKTIRYQEQLEEGKGFKLEYVNIMRKRLVGLEYEYEKTKKQSSILPFVTRIE